MAEDSIRNNYYETIASEKSVNCGYLKDDASLACKNLKRILEATEEMTARVSSADLEGVFADSMRWEALEATENSSLEIRDVLHLFDLQIDRVEVDAEKYLNSGLSGDTMDWQMKKVLLTLLTQNCLLRRKNNRLFQKLIRGSDWVKPQDYQLWIQSLQENDPVTVGRSIKRLKDANEDEDTSSSSEQYSESEEEISNSNNEEASIISSEVNENTSEFRIKLEPETFSHT
jgi:hypothetical protein